MTSWESQIDHMKIIIENLRERIADLETKVLEQARMIAELERES